MNHKEFFEKNDWTRLLPESPADDPIKVEDFYQAIKARMLEEMVEEKNKLLLDLVTTGSSFELNGERIPPEDVFKSVWDDAPDWANWLAQDENGEWWVYNDKPTHNDFSWHVIDGCGRFHSRDKPNQNWRDTLQERPRKQNSEEGKQ